MSLINKRFKYKPLYNYVRNEVIKKNNFRYYKINNILVPSVTSILRLSRGNQNDNFSSKQADSFEIGNLMHHYLDCFVSQRDIKYQDDKNSEIAYKLSQVIINNIFPTVSQFLAAEATVHDNLAYAGTLDLLGVINDKLTVIDYKSSYRKKSTFMIDEHFQQLAAYASAHDKMHNTRIEQAMIFIVYKETYKYDILTADLSLLNEYKLMWEDKLKYYKEVSV